MSTIGRKQASISDKHGGGIHIISFLSLIFVGLERSDFLWLEMSARMVTVIFEHFK